MGGTVVSTGTILETNANWVKTAGSGTAGSGVLAQGPVVIEWAERIREVLPEELLWIRLDYTGMGHRAMMLNPKGKHFETMVENVRRKLYGAF